VAILVEASSQNFPITPVFLPPPSKKGFLLELDTGAGDQKCEWWGNRAEKMFHNNFHLHDRCMNRHTVKWTRQRPRLRYILRLKLHQIVSMCCCIASIIHTYLLTVVPSPVDSNSKP